jgi:hypothetical protein
VPKAKERPESRLHGSEDGPLTLTVAIVGTLAFKRQLTDIAASRRLLNGPVQMDSNRHLSFIALEAVSTRGEKTYSRMRRLPVAISTVTAMPGLSGVRLPSIIM